MLKWKNNKQYVFDTDKLNYVFRKNGIDLAKEKEITEIYDCNSVDEDGESYTIPKLNQKVIREINTNSGPQDNFEVNIIKQMINIILGIEKEEEESLFSFEICFNTLLEKGFIKEIND